MESTPAGMADGGRSNGILLDHGTVQADGGADLAG